MPILSYLFYPNPGNAAYTSPKAIALIGVCVGLIVLAGLVKYWRRKQKNPVTRKLSTSWPSTLFWFGVLGLVLVVARVENIQFVAMRALWVLWGVSLLVSVFFQAKRFRTRNYEILPLARVEDPLSKYLPQKHKR